MKWVFLASILANASSNMRIGFSRKRLRAIPSLCFCPSDRVKAAEESPADNSCKRFTSVSALSKFPLDQRVTFSPTVTLKIWVITGE